MLYLTFPADCAAEYCTSGRFVSPEGGAVHPDRQLGTYVVLFGSEGEYRIEQNGTEYALSPGTFLILFAGYRHRGTSPCPPGLAHYWCHFFLRGERVFDSDTEAERTAYDILGESTAGGADRILLPEYGRVRSPERFRLLFHSLIDRSRSVDAYRERVCGLILSEILFGLSDAFVREGGDAGRGQQAAAAQIVEYIRGNAAGIRSVAEVAAHFGYNPEYMTTMVRRMTGASVLEHIHRARIEEAKRLLLSTSLTVGEIAALSGFSDARYFSRLFQRETDLTPGQYRSTYFKIHTNRT